MPIYMKYDGIDGAVTESEHAKWIECESCQLAVQRSITAPAGRRQNRKLGAASVGEIEVTKRVDTASAKLFRASVQGTSKSATIDFVTVEQGRPETYLKIEFENVLISSYALVAAGSDLLPTESLALNYTKITFHTYTTDPVKLTSDTTTFDLAEDEASG